MFQIDYYAYSNRLAGIHPAEKGIFSLVTLVICLLMSSYLISGAVIVLMSGAIVLFARIPVKLYAKLLTIPIGFLFIGVIAIAISVASSSSAHLVGFYIFGVHVGISSANLYLAGQVFLKALGATCCLYYLALTTPMVDIIALLRKIKVPALFVELMSLIYRYIFVLAETSEKIFTSQTSRLGYVNVKTAFYSMSQLVSSLLLKSLYRSKMLFVAMTSRGYEGDIQVLDKEYSVSMRNIMIIVLFDVILLLLGIGEKFMM